MIVLGLNAHHGDAAACLIRDGEIVAAAEEERLRRVKHWAGFPARSIAYCLDEAGVRIGDVDHLAVNADPMANLARKVGSLVAYRPKAALLGERLRNRGERDCVRRALVQAFPRSRFAGRVHKVEHHLAHLASAFWVSPYRDAAVVSIDGFGDFSSVAWGEGSGEKIHVAGRIYFPHSLGIFYQAITQFLGFYSYGDEYKVMGLSAYGEPRFCHQMRKIVRLREHGSFGLDLRYFRHHRESILERSEDGAPKFSALFSDELTDLLGSVRRPGEELGCRHRDIAASAQAIYEDAFIHLLNGVARRTRRRRLALAGGCAMNSVANGKIRGRTPFTDIFIQPAAGDAGGALGAAAAVWMRAARQAGNATASRRPAGFRADLGPKFDNDAVARCLEGRACSLRRQSVRVVYVDCHLELVRRAAESIAAGKVVGWFQGRMEWGPRALGNRSILCDPRRGDMKCIVNRKIKHRESYRPFAPAVLREHVADWFCCDLDLPFMTEVHKVREEKRAAIPAVTHVDGTGRVQTVDKDANPRFRLLLASFFALTGVPMVLNTSFNENEPIVCTPAQALDCFLRTGMDVVVMENYFVERRGDDRI